MVPPQIVAAPTTAFAADGRFDRAATRALFDHVAGHVDAVFAPGTTGEFAALSAAERAAIVGDAVDALGADRVVAHVGAASTREAITRMKEAADAGACRFAAITPYFVGASATGVRAHFEALREASDGVLLAYVYPELTGCDVSPALFGELAAIGLDGIKTSGRAATRVADYLAAAPARAAVYSGADAEFLSIARMGAAGVVSGVSGVVPGVLSALRSAYYEAEHDRLADLSAVWSDLVAALGPSIACLKYGLDRLGLPGGWPRMSIDPPTAEQRRAIDRALARAGDIALVPALAKA